MPDTFKNMISNLKSNWVIYAAIFSAIFWAARMQNKLEDHAAMLLHIGNEGSKIKLKQIEDGANLERMDERTIMMQLQLQRIENKLYENDNK